MPVVVVRVYTEREFLSWCRLDYFGPRCSEWLELQNYRVLNDMVNLISSAILSVCLNISVKLRVLTYLSALVKVSCILVTLGDWCLQEETVKSDNDQCFLDLGFDLNQNNFCDLKSDCFLEIVTITKDWSNYLIGFLHETILLHRCRNFHHFEALWDLLCLIQNCLMRRTTECVQVGLNASLSSCILSEREL